MRRLSVRAINGPLGTTGGDQGSSRTGSWAVGPNAVLALTTGKWVLGALALNLWTFSDDGNLIDEIDFLDIDPLLDRDGDREVNKLVIQPFINWNFSTGWALATSPIITANWDKNDGNRWTVPIGLGISRTTLIFGKLPILLSAQYYNIVRPDFGPKDQLRLQLNFLLPRVPASPAADDDNGDND